MKMDMIAYWSRVSNIAQDLPGAVQSASYGTPAYKVNKKLFARLREDGKTLVVYSGERELWMKKKPATFFITDHYKNYPWLLVDLATVTAKDLKAVLLQAWRLRAPKRLLDEANQKKL